MIYVNNETCTGCGTCLEICPENAIVIQDAVAHIEDELCKGCELCVDSCPQGAILCVDLMLNEPSEAVLAHQSKIVPLRGELERRPGRPALLIRALPAIGSALVWAGTEILPHLAPLALDLLDQRRHSRMPAPVQSSGQITSSAKAARPQSGESRVGRFRRHRRCRGERRNRNRS